MAPVNRQFTYKRHIKVSGDDFTLAKNGAKICTIRLGVAKIAESLSISVTARMF